MSKKRGGRLGRTESSLTVQSVLLTSARFIGFVAAFAIPIVLVRVFDRTDFGIYKQVFLISATASQVLTLGLPASLFYFMPRDEHGGQRYLTQAFSLTILAGAIGAVVLILGAPLLVGIIDEPALIPMIPAIAVLILLVVPAKMAHQPPVVDQRPWLGGAVMAGSDFLRAGAIVGAAMVFRSVLAVIIAAAAVEGIRLLFLAAYTVRRRTAGAPGPTWVTTRTQLGYALGFWVSILLQVGLRSGHTYYVMAVLPSAGFAIYAIGIFQLPIVQHMVDSVAEVMIVRASEAYRAGDFNTLRGIWRRVTVRLGALLIPIWFGAQLFARDLFLLLFGPEYLPAIPVFRIFVGFFLLRVIVDHGILRATSDTGFIVKANAAGLVAMLVALPFLTRWHVMLGAVTSFVIGFAISRFAGLYKVCKRLDLRPADALQLKKLWRAALIALVATVLTALTTRWLPFPALRLATGGPLFGLLYGLGVYVFGPVPRDQLDRLLARVLRRKAV